MKHLLLLALFFNSGQLFAETCVFDPSSANDIFLTKNPNIEHYAWNDKDKVARALLKDGSLLYIKKWACNHIGMDARLIEFYGDDKSGNIDTQLQRVVWFGSQILGKSDYKILENSILKKTYQREEHSSGYILRIPHGTYSEFYVELTRLNYMQVITITYYHS